MGARIAACLAALVVGAGLFGCSGGSSPANPMCAGSTPGTQVVVYSTTGLEYWFADVFAVFQQKCRVAVTYVGAQSSQILGRLRAESAAPLADVAVAFPTDITVAADDGLLAGTPGAAAVPAKGCDAQRRWCEVAEDYVSWVINPQLVAPAPTHWSDLLDGRFKGQVLTSGPTTPIGLADTLLLHDEMGAAAGAYESQLEASTAAHFTITDTMSKLVAAGVALAANGDLQEDLNDIAQYQYLSVWFPSVGATPSTIALPYGAALVKGGHNPGNGRALLAYLWSAAAQNYVGESYAAPALPVVQFDPRAAQVQAALTGVTIIHPDWQAVTAQVSSLVAYFNATRSAPDGVSVPPTTVPVP
jgi:2-aminoethylphosphonate transport system substrate-binding protein